MTGIRPPGYLGAPRRAPPGAHRAPGYLGATTAAPRGAPPAPEGRSPGYDTLQMLP